LIVLGTLTVAAGFFPFASYITPTGVPGHSELHLMFSIAPVLLAITGIAAAYLLYFKENEKPAALANSFGSLYKAAYRKFYIDEAYLFVTKNILFGKLGKSAAWFDRSIVDGLVNTTGNMGLFLSELSRGLQSGRVQHYAIWFLAGIIALTVFLIY
jgi:NADH-quinone oxidoreductase subunit L